MCVCLCVCVCVCVCVTNTKECSTKILSFYYPGAPDPFLLLGYLGLLINLSKN